MEHLRDLNEAQKKAVITTDGPLLVLAGAGAGKTRVIVHRIRELIARGVEPSCILAITFTNKAAREMRERIQTHLKDGQLPFVSTFHSLGLTLIKENYRRLGFTRFPIVYDRADSLKAIKAALKEAGLFEELDPRGALAFISKRKGEGERVEDFSARAGGGREEYLADTWRRYEQILREDQALDFDDLLTRALTLLSDKALQAHYQNRWTHVHVDEYQDTNGVQASIIRALVGPAKNVCAVGDIDQTIYTWRGARIENIIGFEKMFQGGTTVILEENYRSTKTILAAANDIISRNRNRVEKHMFTENTGGEKLSLHRALTESEEAQWVARMVADRIQHGVHPRECAVLYRANFQSRALEEAFLHAGIPYQVLGTRFFERAEVKDVLAYIRAALFGASADIARIANVPRRGIGRVTLLSMLEGKEERLSGAVRGKITLFRELLSRIQNATREMPPSTLVHYVVEASGIEAELRKDKAEGQERLENLRELAAVAARFDTLPMPDGAQSFLESATLASDQDEMKDEADAVRLMTVHSSKGLEFPYVFITGLEEGLFPYRRDGDEAEDAEEERRLLYVAVTRAEKKVFLSYAAMRTVWGMVTASQPSSFLADISEDFIEEERKSPTVRTIYLD